MAGDEVPISWTGGKNEVGICDLFW